MKKAILILLAALLLAALCACSGGEKKPPELSFKNSRNATVDNIYISPVEEEEWSTPVNLAKVESGHTIQFDFDKVGENAGPGRYDVGAIDENAMNYDVYDVELAVGDQIELSGTADKAEFIITHADGTKISVEAWVYPNE